MEQSLFDDLAHYTTMAATESQIACELYGVLIKAALDGEPCAEWPFILTCLKQHAETAIRNYRLTQIAALGHVYDPKVRLQLAGIMQSTSSDQDLIIRALDYHSRLYKEQHK